MTRLTVELVPSTCWWSNVRSHLAPSVWERLRRTTAAAAGNRCEICGGRGRRHPVECHELLDYDTRRVQRLVRLIALCPACHEVKHLGLAAKRGRRRVALVHLAKVNGWTAADAECPLQQRVRFVRRSSSDVGVLRRDDVCVGQRGTPGRLTGQDTSSEFVGAHLSERPSRRCITEEPGPQARAPPVGAGGDRVS